jgi:hypothetical protein
MEVQINMLNAFGIILFYEAMGWFDGQDINVEPRRPRFSPLTNIYHVEYVNTPCTCV